MRSLFSQLLTEEAEAAVQPQLYGDYILENDGDGKKYGKNCSYILSSCMAFTTVPWSVHV